MQAERAAADPAAAHPELDPLKERLAELIDLRRIRQLLFWDQQTKMPPRGAAARGEQTATISRLAHERFVSAELAQLLDDAEAAVADLPPDSDDARLVRVTRRDWEKARRVPPELTAEIQRASTAGLQAWAEARPRNDFQLLRPHLERHLELKQQYVECFDPADERYDVLLDDFEPGMKTADVRRVFERVKPDLIALAADAESDDGALLDRPFDRDAQERFALHVVERFGYEPGAWRIDPTPHAFLAAVAPDDIRLATMYKEKGLVSLFATMHEFGHGIYEHSVDGSLARTPLGSGASMALHESQSRLWENIVGRSRGFWSHFFGEFARTFPDLDADEERVHRAVNAVKPSLIRGDADEVTYCLHIILRFELEQELLEERLAVSELPEAWNARMKAYLGIDVPDDADGVLQDMHWPGGVLGYFPTYALGNVISVQIWNAALAAEPRIPDAIGEGDFAPLREWLIQALYRHGRKFTPQETLERVTGRVLDPEPYLAYLREKYAG
jgi:carboxypeptidase Taq